MEHNKAHGPDSFPTEFYQNFWNIIKVDLMELFEVLYNGQLELFKNGQFELFKLNFGEIILLPKIKDA